MQKTIIQKIKQNYVEKSIMRWTKLYQTHYQIKQNKTKMEYKGQFILIKNKFYIEDIIIMNLYALNM